MSLLLSLAVMLPSAAAIAADTTPETVPEIDPFDGSDDGEDDDADYSDDGSRFLIESAGRDNPHGLRAVSPAEEKSLLGDWGDSESNAED